FECSCRKSYFSGLVSSHMLTLCRYLGRDIIQFIIENTNKTWRLDLFLEQKNKINIDDDSTRIHLVDLSNYNSNSVLVSDLFNRLENLSLENNNEDNLNIKKILKEYEINF